MSLPRQDPKFTMNDLAVVGQKFLDAGYDYFEACCKAGIDGAVIWLQGEDGKLAIFTRGEYRDSLMRGIECIGPVRHFGAAKDE